MALPNALEMLRERIGIAQGFRSRSYHSFSLLSPGIPKGALSEITGTGKTEFLIRFLNEHPTLKVAWIEEQLSIFPYAIFQRQARLERMLFIEAGSNSLWALRQILRSQVFGLIVFSSTTTPQGKRGGSATGQAFYRDERVLRMLQITAKKSQASVVFLSNEPCGAWPVSLQLKVERNGFLSPPEAWGVQVLRCL